MSAWVTSKAGYALPRGSGILPSALPCHSSGTVVTDKPSEGDAVDLGYCVQGPRLHIITPDPTMTAPSTAPSGQVVIAGDVVGVKE